jgi:DNA-binding NarL/FixJ family response regulator
MAVRILVVDDHPLTILSLRILFEEAEDIEVVGEAGSGLEFFNVIGSLGNRQVEQPA